MLIYLDENKICSILIWVRVDASERCLCGRFDLIESGVHFVIKLPVDIDKSASENKNIRKCVVFSGSLEFSFAFHSF